jgi:PEGA domain
MQFGRRWIVFVVLVGCAYPHLQARDLSDVLSVRPLAKDVPASPVMSPQPQPWKVGQWVLYKRIVNTQPDYFRESIVAQDECGIWLDEVSESIWQRHEVLTCWREMPQPLPPERAIELLQVVIVKYDDTVVAMRDFRKHPEQRQKWAKFAIERANPWFAHAVSCPTLIGRPVQVESSPPGADVYVGNKDCPIGKTPWSGALPDDVNTVIVDMPGYATATKTVDASVLYVALEPLAEPAAPIGPEIPREDVDVPAGKFASAYRAENGYRTRITWFSPEVPITGEIKARWEDRSVELISYGQDGAPSVIPSLAQPLEKPTETLGFIELGFGNAELSRSRLEEDAHGYGAGFTMGFHIRENPLDVVLGWRTAVGMPYSPDKTMQQSSTEALVGVRWRPFRPRNYRPTIYQFVDWTALFLQGMVGYGWLSRDDDSNVASGLAASGSIEWLPYEFGHGGFGVELSDTYVRFDELEEGRNQLDWLMVLRLED